MPDVVIVGGGVIGAACAHELAGRGASVTLVERDHLAAHASGRNQGLWVLPDDDVNVPMARASLDVYRRSPRTPARRAARRRTRRHGAGGGRTPPRSRIAEHGRPGASVTASRSTTSIARRHREHEPALTRNVAGAWLVQTATGSIPVRSRWRSRWPRRPRGAEIRHHSHARGLAMPTRASSGS